MSTSSHPLVGAIVLAGGRGSRLGQVDKAGLEVEGRTLLDRVLAAVAPAAPVVVVGPERDVPADVVVVREDPPFGGPVAGLAAALDAWPEDGPAEAWWLACDLLHPERVVAALRSESLEGDGVVLERGDRAQWLAGRYRVDRLRAALADLGDVDGASVRRLVAPLDLRTVPDPDDLSRDVDTWADLPSDHHLHPQEDA